MANSHKDLLKQIFKISEANLLSFTDWDRKKDGILKAHSQENVALILLDQINKIDTSSSNGKTVLSEIIQNNGFCVLSVSNNCNKDDEFNATEELLKDISAQIKIDTPIFVFSKSRLTNEIDTTNDIVSFLSRFILSNLSVELASKTKTQLTNAINSAFESLKRLSFVEFMHAIHLSSQNEGISELDTLLRMFAIKQRSYLFKAVMNDSNIRDLLSQIRSLGLPSFTKNQLSSISSLTELRHSEVYEPPEVINALFEPISVGDIFSCTKEIGNGEELTSVTKNYVLIGNSCDLMIRGNTGERSLVGEVLFLPILNNPNKDQSLLLPCSLDPSISIQGIDKRNFLTIPIDILDLCSYNENGESIWISEDSLLEHKSKLLPSQILRAKKLASILTSDLFLRCRINHLSTTKIHKPIGLSFNIKRIARLTPDLSASITQSFSSAIARPSLAHDYLA